MVLKNSVSGIGGNNVNYPQIIKIYPTSIK